MSFLKVFTTLILGGILLAGCDSDFDDEVPTIPVSDPPPPTQSAPTEFNVVTGTVSKGIVAGATVSLIDADGMALDVTATTGDDGSYSLEISADLVAEGVATPLQVIVTSDGAATMMCDADLDDAGTDDCYAGTADDGSPVYAAFGETFTLSDDFEMRALVESLPEATDEGASVTVNPTPLTDIATALALGNGMTLTADQVADANDQVRAMLSGITGVDFTDVDLDDVPVVNLADIEAAAAASEVALAAATFSASLLVQVDPADDSTDTIAEALAATSTVIHERVQATGNPSAVPPGLLAALTAATADVVNVISARVSEAGLDATGFQSILDTVSEVAETLAQVPDDVDVVIAPGGDGIDLGDFTPSEPEPEPAPEPAPGNPNGSTEPATVATALVGEYSTVFEKQGPDTDRTPFDEGELLSVTIGENNSLTIGDDLVLTDPFFREKSAGLFTGSIIWFDANANLEYWVINEGPEFVAINVGDALNTRNEFGDPHLIGQLDFVEKIDPDADSGGSGMPPGDTQAASVNSALAGEYTLEYGDFSDDNDNDPFSDGQAVSASVSADGTLTIDGTALTEPYNRVSGGTVLTTEIYWYNAELEVEFSLSNNDTGTFNEINVGDQSVPQPSGFPRFLGQLTGTFEPGG